MEFQHPSFNVCEWIMQDSQSAVFRFKAPVAMGGDVNRDFCFQSDLTPLTCWSQVSANISWKWGSLELLDWPLTAAIRSYMGHGVYTPRCNSHSFSIGKIKTFDYSPQSTLFRLLMYCTAFFLWPTRCVLDHVTMTFRRACFSGSILSGSPLDICTLFSCSGVLHFSFITYLSGMPTCSWLPWKPHLLARNCYLHGAFIRYGYHVEHFICLRMDAFCVSQN